MKGITCHYCGKPIVRAEDFMLSTDSRVLVGLKSPAPGTGELWGWPYHKHCCQKEIDEVRLAWDEDLPTRPERYFGRMQIERTWFLRYLFNPVGVFNLWVFILIVMGVIFFDLVGLMAHGYVSDSIVLAAVLSGGLFFLSFVIKLDAFLKYDRLLE
ncbi:hypothetical protein JXB02_05100 [Candidatus Woesearchaeota archaeon]|nr:hypothetical protein [Candidatus Woesearchaeota archaeon]